MSFPLEKPKKYSSFNSADLQKKSDKRYLRGDLNFFDRNIERSYEEFIRGYQYLHLKLFLVFKLSIFGVNWFINPLSLDLYQGSNLLFNTINFCVMTGFLIFVLKKKNFKHSNLAIFCLQIYIFFVVMEVLRKNHSFWNVNMFIIVSFVFGQLSLFMMIARCPWKLNAVTAFGINIYLNFRLTEIDANTSMRGYPTIIYLCSFLFIAMGSYFNERFDRQIFFDRRKKEKILSNFEHLIKEVLPSSMLIVRKGQVVFYNEQSSRLFNIIEQKEIEPKLRQIVIDRSSEGYKQAEIFNSPTGSNQHNLCEIIYPFKETNYMTQGFHNFSGCLIQRQYDEPLGKILDIKLGKINWEGDDAILVILSEDLITQQMNYLTEQGRYKDKLLATVSHDLRTPLNGVIGILELVLEIIQDAGIRKSLQLALRSSNLLLFMINDILDMSQITSGKLRLNPVDFCPVEVVKDVAKLIKFQAKKKGLKFVLEDLCSTGKDDKQESYQMLNDPNRLKQVILNLMGNALKFTQEGQIRVSIEPLRGGNNKSTMPIKNGSIKITVQDSGCGIKPQDQSRLFKLFGKLDNSEGRKFNQSGIGLGLAISQNLIKLMNNNILGEEIKVNSEYGKGSTFYFPLHSMINDAGEERRVEKFESTNNDHNSEDEGVRAKAIPYIESTKFETSPFLERRQKRVLIVDDDQINILVLTSFFNSFNDCVYDVANNGKQAVERVESRAHEGIFFDIIFMDCNMPVMDGFEATREILKKVSCEEIPFVPIIASTANASEADHEKCVQAGMVDFISKPFSKAQLRAILDQSIKKYT